MVVDWSLGLCDSGLIDLTLHCHHNPVTLLVVMCLNNMCIPAEIVTHRGKDVVELSCSFEGTWILSCSSEVTGGRSHQKNFESTYFCFCFSSSFLPVPLLQMWFLFFFSFSVIISEKHLFFFFSIWVHVHSIARHHHIQAYLWASLQQVMFPGKLWRRSQH